MSFPFHLMSRSGTAALPIALAAIASLEVKGEKREPRVIVSRMPLYKAGRNDPCPCASGKKFKRCCIDKTINVPIDA